MQDSAAMKMMTWLLALTCVLGAGCNRDHDDVSAGNTQPSSPADIGGAAALPGSERAWAGLLPCSDCQGVDTRLVLRSTGGHRDYVMTETYLGGLGKNSFVRTGTWAENTSLVDGEKVTLYILDPDRAGQRFSLQPDGALEWLDGHSDEPSQAVAYRLQRL